MNREEAHVLVDELFDVRAGLVSSEIIDNGAAEENAAIVEDVEAEVVKRTLPEDKRVIRTKTSGDRVYELDEIKKTRRWVTNTEILESRGWELGDVVEVEDNELLKYMMGPAIHKIEEADETNNS